MRVMRIRLLTLLFTALLCLTASGQDETVTGYDCECLIDGVTMQRGTLPPAGGSAAWQVDASALPLGMHQVQTRIVQHLSSGISNTAVYDALCYRVATGATHEVNATCRVDGQVYKTAAIPTNGAVQTWSLDLTDLAEGLHHVSVMIADKDRDGMVSTTAYEAMCYRPAIGMSHEVTASCYVDEKLFKEDYVRTDGSSQVWTLNLAELPAGLHHVRVVIADKDKDGMIRHSVYQAMCYLPSSGASHQVTASCYVDGELAKQETVTADGETLAWTLDWSELPVGLHHVTVMVADKNREGIVRESVYQAICYRSATGEDHEITASFYIEGELYKQETVSAIAGTHTCWLNVCRLPEGTYHIVVEVADTDSQGFVNVEVYESDFYCLGYEILDLNGDGSVNIADVVDLVDVILGDDSSEEYDLNGDGTVNIADVNLLISYILDN